MHLPFYYMLKVSVCLAAVSIFYFLLLRRLTQYNSNRFFLLAGVLLSFWAPLVNITNMAKPGSAGRVFFVIKPPVISDILPNAAEQAGSFGQKIQLLFFWVFVAIALFLLAKFFMQIFSLKKLTARARLVSNYDVLLYNIDEDIAPFSFNRSIYINKNMYSPAELDEVIRHETVHVKQLHTIDVIVAELLCVVNWYNPFAWLLKNSIKQNLEFIADDVVLQKTTDHKAYQYLLLKVTGSVPLGITNNLNVPSLKNRITMMNTAKTSRLHLLRLAFMVPLALVLLPAFRQADGDKQPQAIHTASPGGESFTLGSLTYAINDTDVETIIKNDAGNSFLKPGNVLSFSSIQSEKFRLAGLLQKNGYDTSGSHAIYFEVDTFSTAKSFAIQVTINVQKRGAAVKPKSNTGATYGPPSASSGRGPDDKEVRQASTIAYVPVVNGDEASTKINMVRDNKNAIK